MPGPLTCWPRTEGRRSRASRQALPGRLLALGQASAATGERHGLGARRRSDIGAGHGGNPSLALRGRLRRNRAGRGTADGSGERRSTRSSSTVIACSPGRSPPSPMRRILSWWATTASDHLWPPDRRPGGPALGRTAAGIGAALPHVTADLVIVLACDHPYVGDAIGPLLGAVGPNGAIAIDAEGTSANPISLRAPVRCVRPSSDSRASPTSPSTA